MMIEANDNDSYQRGREDYAKGIVREHNPYDEAFYGTTFWEEWFDGWDDANKKYVNENFFP